MMVSKRNLLFQWLIFRFHVKLQGCISWQESLFKTKTLEGNVVTRFKLAVIHSKNHPASPCLWDLFHKKSTNITWTLYILLSIQSTHWFVEILYSISQLFELDHGRIPASNSPQEQKTLRKIVVSLQQHQKIPLFRSHECKKGIFTKIGMEVSFKGEIS